MRSGQHRQGTGWRLTFQGSDAPLASGRRWLGAPVLLHERQVLGRLERRCPHARQGLLPAVFAALLADVELRLLVLALDELDVHEAGLRLRGALEDQLRLLLRLEPLARRLSGRHPRPQLRATLATGGWSAHFGRVAAVTEPLQLRATLACPLTKFLSVPENPVPDIRITHVSVSRAPGGPHRCQGAERRPKPVLPRVGRSRPRLRPREWRAVSPPQR